MGSQSDGVLWGDEPTDLRLRDEFGRLPFAYQLVKVLDQIGTNRPSSVVALTGSWGAGKSSILLTLSNILRSPAAADRRWLVANLNAWRYATTDSLIAGFFAELRATLPDETKWSEARASLAGLVRTLAPLGSLTSLVGVDSTKSLEMVASQLDGINSASNMQTRAENALRSTGQPILIVIDDVDRLEPTELLSLFRLVRLLGRLPNVHYLLAYDQSTVADVLTQTGLVADISRSREYLEKIVQVRIDLPPVRASKTEQAVDRAIEGLARKFDVTISDGRSADFALVYQQYLAPSLHTPRTIHRWLSHLELLYPPLHGEVDFIDFSLISWLSLQYPGLPALLQRRKASIFSSRSPLTMFSTPDPDAEHAKWTAWIGESGVAARDIQQAFGMLGKLFPTLDKIHRKTANSPDLEAVGRRLGVGHPDYFDRYFNLGVPDDELAESDFLDDLSVVIADPNEPTRLTAFLRSDAMTVVPRIEKWAEEHPDEKKRLLLWLAINLFEADDEGLFSGRTALRGLLFRLTRSDSALALSKLLGPIWSRDELVRVGAIMVTDHVSDREQTQDLNRLSTKAVKAIRQRVLQLGPSPQERNREVWDLLWIWQTLDNDSLRIWYQSLVTSGSWTLLEGLANLVQSQTPVGVKNPIARLGGIADSTIDAFFGMNWFTTALRQMRLQDGPELASDGFQGPDDTWENRMAVARRVARDHASRE